jgi:hypothetical protein
LKNLLGHKLIAAFLAAVLLVLVMAVYAAAGGAARRPFQTCSAFSLLRFRAPWIP